MSYLEALSFSLVFYVLETGAKNVQSDLKQRTSNLLLHLLKIEFVLEEPNCKIFIINS
jgi:hypothetical protein